MRIRNLLIAGLCSLMGTMSAPIIGTVSVAQAQEAPAKTFLFSKSKTVEKVPKGKKLSAKEQAKLTAAAKKEAAAAAKKENAAKAKLALLEKKKMQMRLAAKKQAEDAAQARVEARTAARQALADKSKQRDDARSVAAAKRLQRQPVAVAAPVVAVTAERLAAQEAAAVGAEAVVRTGNNGELRSGDSAIQPSGGFFQILFGDEPAQTQYGMLPETRALDSVLERKKKFKVNPIYEPQSVAFGGYPRGTIVIDTDNHFLYYVEGLGSARRYGIAVGRDGLQFKGTVAVGDKQEWPRWIPTKEMQQREPKKYGRYKDGMPGGGQNPLGARAIYLYQGKQDTHLRIHGTIAPESIGTNSSNGCFRMINDHVIDLYRRVGIGTRVVIL